MVKFNAMENSISHIDKIFEIKYSVDIDEILLESVKSLVKTGEVYKAYGLSKLIQEGYESSESLIIIAEGMIELNYKQEAVTLLNKAEIELLKEPQEWKQADLLCMIAEKFHKLKLDAKQYFKKAIEIAKKGEASEHPQMSVDSSSMLIGIAHSIALAGYRVWALEIANEIKNPRKKELALEAIESL
jgi:hypothetical protein